MTGELTIDVACPGDPPHYVKAGDLVYDDLTGEVVRIVRLDADSAGNVCAWTDSPYPDGGRFPWELSPASKGIDAVHQTGRSARDRRAVKAHAAAVDGWRIELCTDEHC